MTQQDYLDMAAQAAKVRAELNRFEKILDRGVDPDTRSLLNTAFVALAALQSRCYAQATPRTGNPVGWDVIDTGAD